jgi:3-oxoadipate enol-lactonase
VPFVDIGGLSLHCRFEPGKRSRAPALVFINSLGTDFRIWDAVSTMLGEDVSHLVYDKRGHGLSDTGPGGRSIDDHVNDLIGLVDHFGLEKIVPCGLSVGGQVALGCHARRPEAVAGLMLFDTAHKIGDDDSWNQRIATVERDGIGVIADGIMNVWFTPTFHRERAAELAGCRNMLVRQPVDGYVATCMAVRDADYTDAARHIDIPALCAVGEHDDSTSPALVKSLADLIPGARFEVIRDAAHIPCIERSEAVVALIRGFLASLPEGSRS